MRKLVLVLVSFLLVFGSAYAEEIAFYGIPWLSNDEIVLQKLKDANLVRAGIELLTLSEENIVILSETEALGIQQNNLKKYKGFCYSASLKEETKGRIAGFPVDKLVLNFAYDGEYKLLNIKVDLLNADYDKLKDKLILVYGQGETKVFDDEGAELTIWKGDNNSAIVLYAEREMMNYHLYYGRLDAVEILENCLANPDSNDLSGL